LGYYQPRRRHRRFRRRLLRVLVDYTAGGNPCCEYATTLGAGGLFIETEAPLAPGTMLCVRFRVPGSDSLHRIEGRVTWQHRADETQAGDLRPSGMGVEFTDARAAAALAHELETLDGAG
jgi:uncharacterized protein (TIGR02266 family)